MTNGRSCFNLRCNYVTADNIEYCPNCGRRMRSTTQVRVLGWVQALLGVFLISVMGVITYKLGPSLIHPGVDLVGHNRFNGTEQQGRLVLALFSTVILFGLITLAGGAIQIKSGRRSRWVVILTLVLVIPLVFLGIAVSRSLETSGAGSP